MGDHPCDTALVPAFADASILAPGGGWDDLLSRSGANTVFLTGAWLKAWLETLGRGRRLIMPTLSSGGRLLAAGAFIDNGGVLEFAGMGPSDYADLVVDDTLADDGYRSACDTLLECAAQSVSGFRHFNLARIPEGSRTVRALDAPGSAFPAARVAEVEAPIMAMSCVEDRLRKKSLVRHERGLARRGQLDCATCTRAGEVLPHLEAFFDQHVARWQGTDSPSLFEDRDRRDFYRAATRHLGAAGTLRFTRVTLDDALAAAHFGFMHNGTFIWYKPSFAIDLARYSPGEVLLKRLLEQARCEGADWFDFTIGNEAFKLRFATEVRRVVYLHVTPSRISAMARRARVAVGKYLRSRA